MYFEVPRTLLLKPLKAFIFISFLETGGHKRYPSSGGLLVTVGGAIDVWGDGEAKKLESLEPPVLDIKYDEPYFLCL